MIRDNKYTIEDELFEYIKHHSVVNTHTHHMSDKEFKGFTLDKLLKETYVDWCQVEFGDTYESRKEYLEKVRYKSYFKWLQKGIQELYAFNEEITADNWNDISKKIQEKHIDNDYHLTILKEKCNYKNIILDTYWDLGSDNNHPDIFSTTFRVDPFFCGYSNDVEDHDGNFPEKIFGKLPNNLDDYINCVDMWINKKKQKGSIALKVAIAYDRGLDFSAVSKEKAEKVFKLGDSTTKEDIKNFQDYLFFRICEMAAKYSLPLQVHTGMGQLTDTRAIEMKEVIEKNLNTKFVLFHCSFPWTSDILALLHTYPNVYPDLCWLPILSATEAKSTLHKLIDIGTSDKVCWGCDTWTSEDSYGALLAFQYVLLKVLTEKVQDGFLNIFEAKKIVDNILVENAKKLYGL